MTAGRPRGASAGEMVWQRSRLQDVEVRSEAIRIIVAAFELFPSIGQKYLIKHGVLPPSKSLPPGRNIPLYAWLAAFQEILTDIGPNALFKVGQHIISNPHLPNMEDVEARLRHIDIAYHMSHFKGGKPMFDVTARQCIEGIGHFSVERRGSERVAIIRCDTPYPCPLEHGILTGVAQQIEPRASVVHHEPHLCRMKGAETCAYLVKW